MSEATVLNKEMVNKLPDMQADGDYRATIRNGLKLLTIGFGGFFLWAVLAPLDEAVPTQGTVTSAAQRQRVDHIAGGIVGQILVREGERVQEGQDLVRLDPVQVKAALNATLSQWRIATAVESRLKAERIGAAAVTYPQELSEASSNPEIMSVVRAQDELFRARSSALQGEITIIRESAKGLEQQLRSLDQLKTGREKQVQLFRERLAAFEKLNKSGFVSSNQLIEIERQLSEVQSKQSEDLANIAGINARLAEYRMRSAQREAEYRREVETLLGDAQKEAATLAERLGALRDTHSRLAVRAPVAGTVVDLAFHTLGSSIKAGERILDIVPEDGDLIVEAQVPPQYIDQVRPGLTADVHFDAYGSRAGNQMIRGTVQVVSADTLMDQRTGNRYYALRVSVSAEEIRKLQPVRLQPGMQGTVMVKTGERSLLAYLAQPFTKRFRQGLIEN